jgi:hypothetical protein
MSSEFDYSWAKDLVLSEMEKDGVLHRAKRVGMSAVCASANMRAYGAGLLATRAVSDGFAAASAVFTRLAAASDPWSAGTARPNDWLEAARRARAKVKPAAARPADRIGSSQARVA